MKIGAKLVLVIAGTSQVVMSVPATAAVPLIPASEPTAPPPNQSLGSVWMLLIATWKPNRIAAISSTA